MSILKAIQEYFAQSPMIQDDSTVYPDYLPSEANEYAIYQAGDTNGGVAKSFVGGDKLMQFTFIFASKFNYSNANTVRNISNSEFYENLQEWIEDNNEKGILPNVNNAIRIDVLQTGTLNLVEQNETLAEYQMICRLFYYKEKEI